jgi:prepilin-type processing-associated H-X9-DG protein
MYAQARKATDLVFPGPERTSVFLEEHPDSINDPFLFPPRQNMWVDVVAGLHGNATSVAFADGHVQMHQWRQSLRNQRVFYNFRAPSARTGDADISWVSFHSNRRTERSY